MITKDSLSRFIYGSYMVYYKTGQIMVGHIIYDFGDVPSLKDIQNKIIEFRSTEEHQISDVSILNLQFLTEEAYQILSKA